jgi:hypothetical protein
VSNGAPREIFDCDRVRDFLDSYLEGQVPPPESRAMRLHIHACPACHRKALSRDILQLFAPLADQEQGDEFWAGFWPAIRADLHAEQAEQSHWWSIFLRPAVAWGTAAILLVAVVLALSPLGKGSEPSVPVLIAEDMGDGWQDVLPDQGLIGEPTLPTVAEVKSPSAQVLSLKIFGEDLAVTEVVLIVDEAIDL